jgi:hypothetical protein
MKFREAVTRAGTFFLAQGNNGAIYGALTFISIANKPGAHYYGPGETLFFSVTNKKIFKYNGKTGTPMTAIFYDDTSRVCFVDGDKCALGFNLDNGLYYGISA